MFLIMSMFLCNLAISQVDRDKEQSRELLMSGDQKLQKRFFNGAISDYNRAIELDPEYKQAFNHRGLAKFYLNDFNSAIRDYDRALEIDPKFIEAYYNRGLAYYGAKDYSAAISDFDKVIEMESKDANSYFMRGLAKTYLPTTPRSSACEDFLKAKELGHKAKTPGQQDASYMLKKYCAGYK